MIISNEEFLRKPCKRVSVNKGLQTGRKLLSSLLTHNKRAKIRGVGLAAPQIGLLEKVCVVLVPKQMVLINPFIIKHSTRQSEYREGCLSFPNVEVDTYRWDWVIVGCDNMKGEIFFGENKIDSVVIQHELDHLSQILFFDRTKDLTESYEGFKL